MSLIARFDGNMNVIGRLLKEYRIKKDLSYEKLSAKLELMGISIHKQSLYDIENNKIAKTKYDNLMRYISMTLKELEDIGIPREDSANGLPLGMMSKIVCKHNFRNLVDA